MTFSVEAVDVTKRFGASVAVDGVSVQVQEGSIYGLVGANGAGKTTLLRLVIGMLQPDGGEVRLFGERLPRDAAALRQQVQYVAPDMELFRTFTVQEMLRYTGLLYEHFDAERCDRLLDVLQVSRTRRVRHLSTGMKMQMRLAMALSTRPQLLVLDEPATGLDPVVKRQFLQLILQEAAGYGTAVIMATHQLEDVERLVDHVAFMYQGRIVKAGDLEALRGSICKLQVVLPQGLPSWLEDSPHLLHTHHSGQLYTLVLQDIADAAARLREVGATYVETVSMDLDEVFQYVMEKEGYVRNGILLS